MTVVFDSVAFFSQDPAADAAFWATLLGRPSEVDVDGVLLPGGDGQVGLRFASGAAHGPAFNRLHAHLSEGPHSQAENIAASIELGARLRGNGHVPVGGYAAMATPAGDEFCVIEDGNGYLAGCGPLGEITCEGSREVGLFWSAVLDWPLVWEEGDETAIQQVPGGTKIAWSGEAPDAASIDARQHFVLRVTSDDLDAEIERMLGLGATDRVDVPRGAALLDPDGVLFVVRTS